ncbi:extracellular solute-binding protein [Halomicroarcula limicola]|uniref:Extracellular solute-binding protein n=1 Tax=Haloarcula limicola TaxID=1429915 RepID=A0A8J7YCW5_9EURY|nr:extracellular solute-binding protein [Halomicroarcula limicola]MBV0926326.1 extracellular solute-binding protein [Halomicroarcula limicola]
MSDQTRRQFITGAGAVGAVALAGCGGQRDMSGGGSSGDGSSGDGTQGETTGSSGGGSSTLNVLTWEGYGAESILSEFEEKNDATVNIKLISSDPEAFNILKSGGVDKFDLITLNNSWAQRHARAGTIESLNPDDYPEMDAFMDHFQWPLSAFALNDEMYALPTRWGWDTMTVNSDKVQKDHYSSYDVLWTGGPDQQYQNKIGIMDWPTWNIPKVAMTLGYPPFEQNEEQLADIKEKLIQMFSNMKAVYSGTSALRQALLQEDIVMAPVGNFAMSDLRAAGNEWVEVTVPEEGGMLWTEGMCIVKNPSNRELAVKYQREVIQKKGQYTISWEPSSKSPPVNTDSFDQFDSDQQEALMFDEKGFDAAPNIIESTTQYEFSPITSKWTDLWTEAKARAGI